MTQRNSIKTTAWIETLTSMGSRSSWTSQWPITIINRHFTAHRGREWIWGRYKGVKWRPVTCFTRWLIRRLTIWRDLNWSRRSSISWEWIPLLSWNAHLKAWNKNKQTNWQLWMNFSTKSLRKYRNCKTIYTSGAKGLISYSTKSLTNYTPWSTHKWSSPHLIATIKRIANSRYKLSPN